MFDSMDRDGDGELDIEEMEAALENLGEVFLYVKSPNVSFHSWFCLHFEGIPLSRSEAKRVIQKFSSRGNSIKFREFVR